MTCKNCGIEFQNTAKFCMDCGARVVIGRVTVKTLVGDFVNKVFGWDNTYFRTLRMMIVSPDSVVSDYTSGVRKKYMSPITFFIIGLTLATLVFNIFSDRYIEFSTNLVSSDGYYRSQYEMFRKDNSISETDINKRERDFQEYRMEQENFQKKWSSMILKYFNLSAFIFMPYYAFVSMLVFGWKRLNYAEHLVANSYVQGLSMISITLFFFIACFTYSWIYPLSVLVTIFYYSFTYKKLYELSITQTLLRLIKFIFITVVSFIVLMIIILLFMLAISLLFKINLFEK